MTQGGFSWVLSKLPHLHGRQPFFSLTLKIRFLMIRFISSAWGRM
jgi:hypothetical protein